MSCSNLFSLTLDRHCVLVWFTKKKHLTGKKYWSCEKNELEVHINANTKNDRKQQFFRTWPVHVNSAILVSKHIKENSLPPEKNIKKGKGARDFSQNYHLMCSDKTTYISKGGQYWRIFPGFWAVVPALF